MNRKHIYLIALLMGLQLIACNNKGERWPEQAGLSAGVALPEGAPLGGAPSSGIPAASAPAGGVPMAGEPMAGEPMAGEPMAGEPMAGEPMAGEPAGGEPMAGEPMAGEPAGGEPMAGEPMAGEPMAGEPMAGEPMAGEPAGGEPMAGEPAGGEPAGGEPAGGEPAGGELVNSDYNLCGQGADQARADGVNSAPIIAPYSPFVDQNNTAERGQDLYNSYDCAPDRREYGRELVYQFTMPATGYFRAEVLDPLGVDIDLHLLQNPSVDQDGLVSGCLARNDRLIEYNELPAGTYQLVADSWTNTAGYEYEGSFQLAFEWLPYDQWTEAPLREGISLKRFLGEVSGARRLVHAVLIDADQQMSPLRHSGCEAVPSVLGREGALVGINANYFEPSQVCTPTDFLKVDGVTISQNRTTNFEQRAFGWTSAGTLLTRWLPPLSDWPEVANAVAGYPSLVINSEVAVQVYEGEQVYSATDWSDQPRSALGINAEGQLLLAVADGRSSLSAGIFNLQWAELLSDEFGLSEAIGLDGGGSSTLSVRGCWLNDVVNFPSDSAALSHEGARSVGSGLYVQ